MLIHIGSDHGGFEMKKVLIAYLSDSGYEVIDMGADKLDANDDYVEYTTRVSKEVSRDPSAGKGILLCRSGVGVNIVANKFKNIRASLCFSPDHAMASKKDDDANILCLPSDYIDQEMAKKIVSVWLATKFSGEERYIRRLKKIEELESKITNYYE